jgi:hypothetical protein
MSLPATDRASVHSFAHRRKFRLRALPTAMIRSLKTFLMHAIVLSALRNEQAEFPRLRKTARYTA